MKGNSLGVYSGGGSERRRYERVLQSEDEYMSQSLASEDCGSVDYNHSICGDDKGFSSSPPSFLVQDIDNVNCRYSLVPFQS